MAGMMRGYWSGLVRTMRGAFAIGTRIPASAPGSGSRRAPFLRNQSGATFIEFALLSPVLLTLVMGIIEFAMIMFTSSVMEGATNDTARLGKTGYVAGGTTREQEIINNVANRTAGLLDPAKISVTYLVYSNLNNVGQPEPCLTPTCGGGAIGVDYIDVNGNGKWDPDMGAAGLGNPGDVVVYTVTYPWPIMTPIMQAIIGDIFTVTARTIVRNEPYTVNG